MSTARRRIHRRPLVADRVRRIGAGGFAFVPNRFLLDGFFAALGPDELLLYWLLVLAADRQGMSLYRYETLCSLLQMPPERYLLARNSLVDKELIAFEGRRFQVLELPAQPPGTPQPLRSQQELELEDPATVRYLAEQSLHEAGRRQHRRSAHTEAKRRDADQG
jgi:hypothetical protein